MDPSSRVSLQPQGSYLKATLGASSQLHDAVKEILENTNLAQFQSVMIDATSNTPRPLQPGSYIDGEILGRLWPQDIPLALVLATGAKEEVHLLRIAAASHGLKLAVFTEEQDAVHWLSTRSTPADDRP